MANFPGNPYATDSHFLSNDAAAITKAITLLAFEVRTANLQRQAAVIAAGADWTDVPEETFQLWNGLQEEIVRRLAPQQ